MKIGKLAAAGALLCLACASGTEAWADIARPPERKPAGGQKAEIVLAHEWYDAASGEPSQMTPMSLTWHMTAVRKGERRVWLRRSAPVLKISAAGPARWTAAFSEGSGMERKQGTVNADKSTDMSVLPLAFRFGGNGGKAAVSVEIVPMDCGGGQCADAGGMRTVQRFVVTEKGQGRAAAVAVNGRPLDGGAALDSRVSVERPAGGGEAELKVAPWTGPLPPGVGGAEQP